jgi:hypothetical protein
LQAPIAAADTSFDTHLTATSSKQKQHEKMYPRELHRMRQPVVAVLSSGETMRDGLISSLSIVEASVAAQQQDDDNGPDPQGVTKYISADITHPLPTRKPTSASTTANAISATNSTVALTTGHTVKGILKLGWMHKHQDVLPAVVVLVLGFDVDLPGKLDFQEEIRFVVPSVSSCYHRHGTKQMMSCYPSQIYVASFDLVLICIQ